MPVNMSRKRRGRAGVRAGRRSGRTGTRIVLLLLAAGALMLFALPQFYIAEIRISGERILSEEEIVSRAGLETGRHLLAGISGSPGELFELRHTREEKILKESFPYIKTVEIRSVFPSILSVTIEERVEVAYISIKDGYLIIDADGIALEVLPKGGETGIPVVEGLTAGDIVLGARVLVDKPDYLSQTVILLNAIINAQKDTRTDYRILPDVISIRPVGSDLLFLTLKTGEDSGTITVKARISADLEDDMVWLRFAMQQGKLKGLGSGVLDMTTQQKVFVPDP